ncbi:MULTISPECIES: hypothetical protein [Campylobacter]|nr:MULTISPECIES: hypothetical protein [Campylobacter]MDD7422701.1 hypothetical protein [Campylobacter hominis]MDY3116480.1 hypothetical protein [Campylobacter hominis]
MAKTVMMNFMEVVKNLAKDEILPNCKIRVIFQKFYAHDAHYK